MQRRGASDSQPFDGDDVVLTQAIPTPHTGMSTPNHQDSPRCQGRQHLSIGQPAHERRHSFAAPQAVVVPRRLSMTVPLAVTALPVPASAPSPRRPRLSVVVPLQWGALEVYDDLRVDAAATAPSIATSATADSATLAVTATPDSGSSGRAVPPSQLETTDTPACASLPGRRGSTLLLSDPGGVTVFKLPVSPASTMVLGSPTDDSGAITISCLLPADAASSSTALLVGSPTGSDSDLRLPTDFASDGNGIGLEHTITRRLDSALAPASGPHAHTGNSGDEVEPPQAGRRAPGPVIAMPTAVVLSLALCVYNGSEVGYGGWLVQYLVARDLLNEHTASFMASGFWAGLASGRLIGAVLALRLDSLRLLFASGLLSLVPIGFVVAMPDSLPVLWPASVRRGAVQATLACDG